MDGRGRGKVCLLWDADVDVVFIARDIRIQRLRGIVSFVVGKGSCRDSPGWVIESVNSRSSIRCEQRGIKPPIHDFRVRVSEQPRRSSSSGRIERPPIVGMKGRKRSINIFNVARRIGISPISVRLGLCVGARVEGLPYRKEPVDVCMVEPKDGVEARVGDKAHVSPVADQTVDGVVHVLEGIVRGAAAIREARVGERCVVRLIGDELVSGIVNGLGIGLELQIG